MLYVAASNPMSEIVNFKILSRRKLRASLVIVLSWVSLSGTGSSLLAASTKGTSLSASIVDKSGQPLEHAVVSLHPLQPMQADPSSVVVMDQRAKQFAPTVVALQTGTKVSFPNQDDVRHHVYSFSHPNAFELKLYHGEEELYHRFEHPGVVVLGCNIHDGMVGYLRIVDTPYFNTSNPDGVLTIDNAPPGKYTLKVWHPDIGMKLIEKKITLKTGRFGVTLKLDIDDKEVVKAKSAHRLQSLFRN